MRIALGSDKYTGEQVILNTKKSVNGHAIILGGSGAGKTHTLRELAMAYAVAGKGEVRSIIFDVHGDMFPNHPLVSTVSITEGSRMGLQPLIINRDTEYGGVNKAIKRFINAINMTTTKLGVNQSNVIGKILLDVYWRNGFHADDSKTWGLDYDPYRGRGHPKRYPTFSDVIKYAKAKQREIFIGANSKSVWKLEEFVRKSSALSKKRLTPEKHEEEEIEKARDAALDSYSDFLHSPQQERILDNLLKYSSKDVMSSVITRLEGLEMAGVFKDNPVEFDESKPIHRYDISTLDVEDQKIFIELALGDMFIKARTEGFQPEMKTAIFIDEVKNFLHDKEKNSMLIKYFNEARKFGLGLHLGSQDISHFPDDIITNAALKIILGIDRMYSKAFANRLHIDKKKIDNIAPKKSMLVELKTHENAAEFIEVDLPNKG